MHKKIILKITILIILSCLSIPCYANSETIKVGGSISFKFEDLDIFLPPGPVFSTDETGSVGDLNLNFLNRKIQAGVTLSLAQATENVRSIGTIEEIPFPLSNAYIRAKGVFDVADIKFHLRGKENSIGTLAVMDINPDPVENISAYKKGDGILTAMTQQGLFGDFSVGLSVNQIAGKSETPTTAAVGNIWGVSTILKYEGEYFYTNLEAGITNHKYPVESFLGLFNGGFILGEDVSLSLDSEAALYSLSPADLAIGGGISMSLSFTEAELSARCFGKNLNYGKDTELLTISSAIDDFNTRTGSNELGFDIGLKYYPDIIPNYRLITLNGGFNMIPTGHARFGWNSGILLNLFTTEETPMTAGFNISQYGDPDLGIFGNSDLLWSLFYTINYYGLELKAEGGRKIYEDPMEPAGGNRNSAFFYGLSGTVYF